tara:strand:- start:690 stop:1316 length:627 start_codon:yes stop_codon:yes gene_type:complete
MYAIVEDKKVTQIIKYPTSITINNVRHPRTIFTSWSWSELNKIGIYEVIPGVTGDDKYEITSQPIYKFDTDKVTTSYTKVDKKLDDVKEVDSDGKAIMFEGEQLVTKGLKTYALETAKTRANNYIARFSWLVERSIYDSSKAIPDAVKTYVTAIRKDCGDIETAITNASDMDAFKALHTNELNSDGTMKTVARVNRWTDDTNVKTYIR